MPMVHAVPPLHRWTLPASWQALDLVSDLHLCPALPRTFDAFAGHLRHTDADAVLVLGDLFEVWIGDDQADQSFEHACLELLAEASRRLCVAVMVGNRDFLLGPRALASAHAHALPDPTLLQAFGHHWLLTHGDALCLGDTDYQAFRREVRSPAWQQAFLARDYADREALAGRIRAESQARKAGSAALHDWADVDAGAACQWLQAAGATTLVHGHTHRPGRSALGGDCLREVLTDWDLDGPAPRAEVLRLSARGLERRPPASRAPGRKPVRSRVPDSPSAGSGLTPPPGGGL